MDQLIQYIVLRNRSVEIHISMSAYIIMEESCLVDLTLIT